MENVNLNAFLKIESFNLESLIKDIHLVSLETNDESLLDVIYKIIVTDSNIYIHDRFKGGGIVIFDNKQQFGKYLLITLIINRLKVNFRHIAFC